MNTLTSESCKINYFINHDIVYVHIEGLLKLEMVNQLRSILKNQMGSDFDHSTVVYDLRSWDSLHLGAINQVRDNMFQDVVANNKLRIIIHNDSEFEFEASSKMLVQNAKARENIISVRTIDEAATLLEQKGSDVQDFLREYHQNRL